MRFLRSSFSAVLQLFARRFFARAYCHPCYGPPSERLLAPLIAAIVKALISTTNNRKRLDANIEVVTNPALLTAIIGLNPLAHPIILMGAQRAAEPRPRQAAEAQHSQGRPVPVGPYSRRHDLQRRRQAGMPNSTRVREPVVRSLGTPHSLAVERR